MLCYCSRKSQNLALIRNISVVSNLEQQIIYPRKNPAIPVLLKRTPAIFFMSYITWQFLLAGRLLLRLFRCEMEKRRGVFPFRETNFSFSGKQSGLPIRVICIIIFVVSSFHLDLDLSSPRYFGFKLVFILFSVLIRGRSFSFW